MFKFGLKRSHMDETAPRATVSLRNDFETKVMAETDTSERGLAILSDSILHDAMSNYTQSYPPSTSQTPIRKNIIRKIQDWIDDPGSSHSVLWLSGSGGAGKSVTAQTIVDVCRSTERLAAAFFIRKQNGVSFSQQLFSTIAYQLVNNIPGLKSPIDLAMSLDPTLPVQPVNKQFQSLIVEPFEQSTSIPLRSFIVVIDALDECDDEEAQLSILSLISQAVTVSKLPLRFLITSRPENYIKETFGRYPLLNTTLAVHMDDMDISEASIPSNALLTGSNPSRPLFEKLRHSKPQRQYPLGRKPPYSSPSYPKLVTVQRSNGNAESFSRSLMMLGHGIPVWYPGGDLGKPVEYLQNGLSIGDVVVLDREGVPDFCFNIFLEPDDPIHVRSAPREFQPLRPTLDKSEVHVIPQYFKPGEVISSPGVNVTKDSEDPLSISVTSSEQEGSVIILPAGASREDLLSTDRFHEYVKKNAPHWYQVTNGYAGVSHTNGSLFLVTGCDKASDWASACFPYHPSDTGASPPIELKYTWRPEYAYPWHDDGRARTRFYAPPTSKIIPTDVNTKNQCVFVRGMRISLSDSSWANCMPLLKSSRLFYTYMLHKATSLDLWINAFLVCLRLRMSERRAMKKVTASRLQLFHPNFIIGQVLLGKCPSAEVALLDDAIWCSLTDGGYCTFDEINKLVTNVFEQNTIVEKNGIVSLVPKLADTNYTSAPRMEPPPKTRAWRILPLLTDLRKPSSTKDATWVKAVPVGEHAKLF